MLPVFTLFCCYSLASCVVSMVSFGQVFIHIVSLVGGFMTGGGDAEDLFTDGYEDGGCSVGAAEEVR